MKLLITGGCGFLGSNLAAHAIDQGHDLCILDNLYRDSSERNLQWLKDLGPFSFNKVDISKADGVDTVVASFKPDAVFHLAGQVAMTTSIDDPRRDFEVNTVGSLNLLESIRKHTPDSVVVYSSTNKIYGDFSYLHFDETPFRYVCREYPEGFDETISLDFHSPYGCSKGAADQYFLDYHRIYGLNTVVFRHSTMHGSRQFATFDQGWIGWFCRQAIEKQKYPDADPFTISGTGKQVRDILHVQDALTLYFEALNHVSAIRGKAFNIGGGMRNSLSLLELFDYLEKELNIKMIFTRLPWRAGDQKIFVANVNKVKDLIGWAPEVSVFQGINETLEWIESSDSKEVKQHRAEQ